MLACLRGTVCRPLIIPLPTGLLGVRWLILVLTTLLGVGRQLAVLRLVAVCQLLRRRSPEKHFKESVLASLRRLRCDFGVAWAIDAAVGSRCGFAGSAFLAAGAISCGCACGTTAGNSTAAVSPISIGMLTTGVSLIVLLPDPSRCGYWEDRRPLGSCPRPRSASACPAGRADGSVRRRA